MATKTCLTLFVCNNWFSYLLQVSTTVMVVLMDKAAAAAAVQRPAAV